MAVMTDLSVWWPLINPGGLMIGDDYNTDGVWPDVKRGFDDFFGKLGVEFEISACQSVG